MAGPRADVISDELSREIAEFALYELKNQNERISAMSVREQDQVKQTICTAARTVLEHGPNPPWTEVSGTNGDD